MNNMSKNNSSRQYRASERILKVCILGEGGVGKTTLTKRIITGLFDSTTRMTIGVDFHLLKTSIFDPLAPEDQDDVPQIDLSAQIWDFAGEERFRFILARYCKGAMGGLLCFDLSRYSTTKYIDEWFEIWTTNAPEGAPLILVGTKSDLLETNEDKRISRETMGEIAEKLNINHKFMISAKSGHQIHILANEMLKMSYVFNLLNRKR
jgi:small GTP-binding protein